MVRPHANYFKCIRVYAVRVVWVNTPMMRELRAPFGGYHNSGVGREGGYSCEQFYTEEKTVSIPKTPLNLKKFGDK